MLCTEECSPPFHETTLTHIQECHCSHLWAEGCVVHLVTRWQWGHTPLWRGLTNTIGNAFVYRILQFHDLSTGHRAVSTE
jgi:hypothetical protein